MRSESHDLMMLKIAELKLKLKTEQLRVQQFMQFNSTCYAQQQPPMLEKGIFERLHSQNTALSQAAAYSDMPHHHQIRWSQMTSRMPMMTNRFRSECVID